MVTSSTRGEDGHLASSSRSTRAVVASDVGDLSVGYGRQDGYFQQIGRDPSDRTTGTLQLATGLRVERFLPTSLGSVMPIQVNYARSSVAPELRTYAGLGKTVYLVGMGSHFEIWSEAGWQQQNDLAAEAFSGEMPPGLGDLVL